MNFLKTTVEPCRSVVKKTRVDLFPNNGITISSGHDRYKCISHREVTSLNSRPLPNYFTSAVLIGRNFLEAPLECCAASFIDGNSNVVQHDRQQHIEAKGNRQTLPTVALRRWVQCRDDCEVNGQ